MDLQANGNEFLLVTQMKISLMERHPEKGSDWAEREAKAELERARQRMRDAERANG